MTATPIAIKLAADGTMRVNDATIGVPEGANPRVSAAAKVARGL